MEQLSNNQRVFVVETYFRTNSFKRAREEFSLRFPDRRAPSKSTIQRNVEKYRTHATSLNRNTGNSGAPTTVRTPETIDAVRQLLQENPRTCARGNGLVSKSTFNRITKIDLRFHPYQMKIRHELMENDLQRRLAFCEWFSQRCTHRRFLPNLMISDECSFAMNGVVNTRNVRVYAPRGHPPEFYYERNNSRQTVLVWGGPCGNGLLFGPFFIDGSLKYHSLLMVNWPKIPCFVGGRGFSRTYETFC